MSALWDFRIIKEEVRGLVMKKGINQLSNDNLGVKVNQYFFFKFPQEVDPPGLHGWYEFTTSASDIDYTIDQDVVVSLDGTVYVSDSDEVGDPGGFWIDPNTFYRKYPPKTATETKQPYDFLIYDGEIITMPIPDDTYYVKFPCIYRPTTFSLDTDKPMAGGKTYEEWGSIIAHGTAVDILEKTGDDNRLELVRGWYEKEKATLKKKYVFQNTVRVPQNKF